MHEAKLENFLEARANVGGESSYHPDLRRVVCGGSLKDIYIYEGRETCRCCKVG